MTHLCLLNLANKTKNRTGKIFVQINNGTNTIISNPTIEVKHTWQVYVTGELKIKLFCFFTIRVMEWIFRAVNLNLLAALKFATTQNEPKRAETK